MQRAAGAALIAEEVLEEVTLLLHYIPVIFTACEIFRADS